MKLGKQELQYIWKKRLESDLFPENQEKQHNILRWLLGEDSAQLNSLISRDLESINQTIEYRYSILKRSYLGVSSSQGYRQLITRLASLVMLSPHCRRWLEKKQSNQKVIIGIIQTILQEFLEKESELQSTINWIAQCTQNHQLREALVLASIEEYCFQTIGNKPRFIHHLLYFLLDQKSYQNGVRKAELIQYCA